MTDIAIPKTYLDAIEAAIEKNGVTTSTLRIKHVLAEIPGNTVDAISASFYLRAYKAQNKRVSKVATLLEAAKKAFEVISPENPASADLASAIALFNKSVESNEF